MVSLSRLFRRFPRDETIPGSDETSFHFGADIRKQGLVINHQATKPPRPASPEAIKCERSALFWLAPSFSPRPLRRAGSTAIGRASVHSAITGQLSLPSTDVQALDKMVGKEPCIFLRICLAAIAAALCSVVPASAQVQLKSQHIVEPIQFRSLLKLPDPRGELVRLCAPHMLGRWAHPEAVCGCLHDYAVATVQDADLREALLRGISETGVPTIEADWVPPSKRSEIGPTFTRIAKPTLQCMFEPLPPN
jgi:hypothetical protein